MLNKERQNSKIMLNKEQRKSIASLVALVGVFILMGGVFEIIYMDLALFLSITFFLLAGVASAFLDVNTDDYIARQAFKKGIIAFIAIFGVIVILMGVFLQIEFLIALFIAISLFMISGVVSVFLDPNNKQPNCSVRNKNGIIATIAFLGVTVLLMGVFLELEFNIALFIAISLFIIAGASSQLLDAFYVKHDQEPLNQNKIEKFDKLEDLKPAKKLCIECNVTLEEESQFCYHCGVPQK